MGRDANGRARVLFTYDDPRHAGELMGRLDPGRFEVLSCPRSVPANGWLADLAPDLVLLDAPADERELLRACTELRARTERPVVVLAADHDERVVALALATGIDEYLVGPIGERELAARLEALLRRASRFAPEFQQLGDLALSHADHSVEVRGRKVYLSPIEFRLLACLASAPGHVLTHQTLMSRVWGAEYVDSRHYLRVYIRYLREKLEEDPANPQLIVSEWGVGYRLMPPEAPARGRAKAGVE
jgi:two-component system KDP operon response regulator KdpE